jgi:hypothetical protein
LQLRLCIATLSEPLVAAPICDVAGSFRPTRRDTLQNRFPLRPERVLLLERLVRNELTLQRRLASSRRADSARMASIRHAPAAFLVIASLPLLDREAA